MASPVGHLLVGYGIGRVGGGQVALDGWLVGICALLAVAPDFDFVLGILQGQPALHHQGVSHSLGFAVLVSGFAAIAVGSIRGDAWRLWPIFFAAYVSHLAIDLFGPDGRPPIGIPLLWPFADTPFLSPITLLPGMHHAASSDVSNDQWLAAILSWANARALLLELVFAVPFVAISEQLARRRRRRLPGRSH